MKIENSSFFTLTPKECSAICPEVKNNAIKHFDVAALLAENKEYGIATAHLILGAEELIKFIILFLDSKYFSFRTVKEIREVFLNHRPRHNLIKEFISIWLALKPLIKKKRSIQKKKIEAKETILTKILSLSISVYQGYRNYEWWNNAEQMKQRAFYADYKGTLLLPKDLTEEDYKTALKHTLSLQNELQELISYIESLNNNELEEFKKQIEVADIKNLIGESIKRK